MSDTKATPPTLNHSLAPLKIFQENFCNSCLDKDYCNSNQTRRLTCVLCALVRNLDK